MVPPAMRAMYVAKLGWKKAISANFAEENEAYRDD